VAIVQEARDLAVGRDPLAVGGKRRHGPERIADADRERAPRAGSARLATRVESAQPDGQRVQERHDVNALVRRLLVLEHENRRATGV
jgi:hypothetical protein